MTKSIRCGRFLLLSLFLSLVTHFVFAERITKSNVTIDYTPLNDGKIKVNYAINKSEGKISILIDGNEAATILANSSAQINQTANRRVHYNTPRTSGLTLWTYTAPEIIEEETTAVEPIIDAEIEGVNQAANTERKAEGRTVSERKSSERGYPHALERLNQDPFFGSEAISAYVQKTNSLTNALSQSIDKAQFVKDEDILNYLNESELEIMMKRDEISTIAQEIVTSARISDPSTQATILNSVIELLNNRLNQRENAYNKLLNEVNSIPKEDKDNHNLVESIINYSIIALIVLVILIWVLVALRAKRAKTNKSTKPANPLPDNNPDNPSIVVRRRTTSILKKQSLEDVVGNPQYMTISAEDFTADSAVRNIYIKNTCIKEVYKLYADDLRDSNNPKEDGCMVLGRWVYDTASNTYDVSLEMVVYPGDDAIFKEYELNFGGKIKLRIAEKLRKLRKDTNLQYDLICWIHSHPGLGVFFSNSDLNVQMQLKHSQHPNFLIAFVVDILTSNQELGIFTFRKDGSMNSKADITKMYSLEDMYKWALESDKTHFNASFNSDNYYNLLGSAKKRVTSCEGIELNNSAIIDLTQLLVTSETGIIGWAEGTSIETARGNEYVVSSIVGAIDKPTNGVVGALISVTHMSLPTIQRIISEECARISFVLVYSSRLDTVTSIPVINNEAVTDETYYGEETIDNLKIWTRRKR